MQIRKVEFSKGDYEYTIESFDGKTVRRISTNEEPLESLILSKKCLQEAMKEYLELPEIMNVVIKTVNFGKKEDSPVVIQMVVGSGYKEMGIITRIKLISDKKAELPEDLNACLTHIVELRGELERYIKGERAQQELPFENKGSDDETWPDFE